jgi:N-formylglutamate amidohydrolase
MQQKYVPGVLVRRWPETGDVPVVFDIPRSGTTYPCEFRPSAPFLALHQSVSMHVEKLYEGVVDAGAHWLYALFPNTFIDANRHEADIDPELLDGPWPHPLQTTQKSRLGIGLIHSKCGPDAIPIYAEKLSVAEVRRRIDRYYRPYHDTLAGILADCRTRFGKAYHISCHSMASIGGASTLDRGQPRSDFDIGDRNGQTCDPALTELVVTRLRAHGYNVTINHHYPGAESIRKHAAPDRGVHSLQIEINRALYMNERTFELNDAFQQIQSQLTDLARCLADFARAGG